jgi:ADP-ribose pyrophosphatase YjhB (NUDIX family)
MKQGVRAIIVSDDNILVMKRDKFGKQYYTLIGGHVELGESLDKALFREIHEETMIHVAKPQLVYIQETDQPYGTQYVYVCQYISGVPMLHPDSDERKINADGQNVYTPMWLPIDQLGTVPFLPAELQQRIIADLRDGFPEKAVTFRAKV